jgi:hypothetical protein
MYTFTFTTEQVAVIAIALAKLGDTYEKRGMIDAAAVADETFDLIYDIVDAMQDGRPTMPIILN